jgi:hypothetical protein
MEVLPQALDIIFEVQRKRSNEKIRREKISFPTLKTCFFFPLLWTPCFQTSEFYYFLFILNDLKCYNSAT